MEEDSRHSSFERFTKRVYSKLEDSQTLLNITLPQELTVCVIGASTGIGEHIAYAYAKAGVGRVLICSRNLQDLQPVAARMKNESPGIEVETVAVDTGKKESISQLAETVRTKYHYLDVLVLNAGYSNPNARMCEAPPSEVQTAFNVNAIGTYTVAYYFVPLLLQSPSTGPGLFLTVGSASSTLRRGLFCNPGYSISKLAQARMVEYLAENYDSNQLLAINLQPGTVLTRLSSTLMRKEDQHYLTDDIRICGAACVWITSQRASLQWLAGRFIFTTWDLEELLARKEEIISKDLLKFAIVV